MSLRDLTSRLANPGPSKRPSDFELGPGSTLHNVSSTYNRPPFSSYKSDYLRRQKPVTANLLFPEKPKKYLDNPPR
jgi:hypothetical protein